MNGGSVFPPSLFLSTLTDMGAIITLAILTLLFILLVPLLGAKSKGSNLAQRSRSP